MKKYAVLITLLLAAVPSFGSHGQPSASSQFRGKRPGQTAKVSHRNALDAHKAAISARDPRKAGQAAAAAAAAGRTGGAGTGTSLARPGTFVSRTSSSTTASKVSFVAAARFPLTGADDDETMQVMGDFNGDGNKDVAKLVIVNSLYRIAVLLGKGDGTFKPAIRTPTPYGSDDPIVVGDVNGDGKDDILMVHPEGADCAAATTSAGVHPNNCGGSSIDVLLSNGDGTFATAVRYVITEAGLAGGVLTDINGDGKLDVLVVDNLTPGNVIELLGNGDGTFQAATTLTTLTGTAPGDMFFADFNGDGKMDFAGEVSGQIQVTLATGNTFGTPTALTTADSNYDGCTSTAGDLTGDGKPEIISANCEIDTLTVYVNNGDGSFQTGLYYNNNGDLYKFPINPTVADVNGDGNNDIIVGNDDDGDISVFLGDGTGAVRVEPLSYGTGGYPWEPALVADFNGDGLMDIVESDDEYNLVYLQGYGDGSFRAAPAYDLPNTFSAEAYSYSVASGDFNGDGVSDIVAGADGNGGSTGVVVYLAKGDGSFYPGVSYGISSDLAFVAVADFNGDGKLDIAATDEQDGVVEIFLGNGDGTFSIGLAYPTDPGESPEPEELVTGDFNHDGKMDLAIANPGTQSVGVLLGHGDGTFAAAASYPFTGYEVFSLTAADLNKDGSLDLAATGWEDGPAAIGILLANNDNSGTFKPMNIITTDGFVEYIAIGDLNGDGNVDMAMTLYDQETYGGAVEIALGNGDGTFQTATAYPSSSFGGDEEWSYPANIKVTDWNGDGNMDLVYLNTDNGTLAVALGNGDGTIGTPMEFPASEFVWGMTLADVNNDGALDVVAGNDESGGITVLLNGAGSGVAPSFTLATTTPSATVTAGGAASYTLNLAGRFGYNGTITFACSNLPALATCSFNPTSVVGLGNTPLSTALSIATTATTTTGMLRPVGTPASTMLLAGMSGMGLFGLVLAGSGPKARRRRVGVVFGIMLLMMMGTLVGCSGTSAAKTPVTVPGTPAGSYTVTVTSTGTGAGTPTQSLNVTLIVQ